MPRGHWMYWAKQPSGPLHVGSGLPGGEERGLEISQDENTESYRMCAKPRNGFSSFLVHIWGLNGKVKEG